MAKKKRKLTAWQRHVKSYMAKHKGLSFKEALPKAKLTYRAGSNPAKSRKARPRASSKPRKVKRKMAKKRKRRNPGMTIPLAPIIGLAAGMTDAVSEAMAGNWPEVIQRLSLNYTGFSPRTGEWNPIELRKGLMPLVIGLLVHKFVGGAPLNLNRILARAKVPFIRI